MNFLNKPIGWIINLCYDLIPNYAIALLIFTVVMKLILFPFGIKQQKNMLRQAKLRPKEMAIRNRYAGRTDKATQQKMQQEVMKLYQDENYNPASGCLPMILQLVIIFALYGVIQAPLTYVSDFNKTEIKNMGMAVVELYDQGKITDEDLSKNAVKLVKDQQKKIKTNEDGTKDYSEVGNPFSAQGRQVELVRVVRENLVEINSTKYFAEKNIKNSDLPNFFLTGKSLDLSRTPSFDNFDWLMILPLLTFVFTFGSMKITKKLTYQPPQQAQTADMGCSMKLMDYMMPLMSTFITFSVPAVIAVYWIYNNILSTLQQFILKVMYPIPVFTEEDYKNAEREMNKGIKQPKKKVNNGKRAAHRIDLEDVIDVSSETENKAEDQIEVKKNKGHDLIAPATVKDESDKEKD